MEKKEFITKNAAETQKLADLVLKDLIGGWGRKAAAILALAGELGSGKTTFVQGLAKVLGIKRRITSPSFVIMRRFKIYDLRIKNFFHIDCYRLDKPKELEDLRFKEIINNPKNLVVIEWADKIKLLLPKETIWLKFEWISPKKRKIILKIPNYSN